MIFSHRNDSRAAGVAIPCSEAFSGGFGGRYCKAVLQYYSWHFPAFFFLVLYKEKKRVTTITVRATTYRNRWEKSSRFYLFVFSKQTCRLICSTPESEAKLGRKRAQNRPHPSLSTTASTSLLCAGTNNVSQPWLIPSPSLATCTYLYLHHTPSKYYFSPCSKYGHACR